MRTALQSAGWVEVQGNKWRRPGKDDGISASLDYVAEGVFYCFTSSGHPFEPNKAYTAFQVVGLLEYDGDFSRFASELATEYGMHPPEKKRYGHVIDGPMDANELHRLYIDQFIKLEIPCDDPVDAVRIIDFEYGNDAHRPMRRFCTLGNFSVITGKMKAKKTFLASSILASAAGNTIIGEKFVGKLPRNKNLTLYFDTEQAYYDSHKVGRRVMSLLGGEQPDEFLPWNLRELTPTQRCELIEYCIDSYRGQVGFVLIDGIADLAKGNNDEEEAIRVSSLLMRWTKQYDCHIMTAIHQNKADNWATGHLGSAILKKAEMVIGIEKDDADKSQSVVSCQFARGVTEFEDFTLSIDSDGLPVFNDGKHYSQSYEMRDSPF